ncbi:hypothetical protein B296_00043585 [Ensete ventricosum]|uniref:HVA22-like protein n=1 Tax=Ensete ventricosum TaxID=4639 RepID=A0A426YPD3_ENSVE|nr:hypothetical protein B296_00043585 [Ensete ventricosum]
MEPQCRVAARYGKCFLYVPQLFDTKPETRTRLGPEALVLDAARRRAPTALLLVLGYAYPAYLCYKTVELNKPGIEQLRFWCQYWSQTQQPQQEPHLPSATPPAPTQPSPQETRAPPSPIKSQPQEEESRKADASLQPAAASPDQPQEPVSVTHNSETGNPPSPSEEPMQADTGNSESVKVSVPPPEQTAMEEAIRVTRNRLRQRAAAGPA